LLLPDSHVVPTFPLGHTFRLSSPFLSHDRPDAYRRLRLQGAVVVTVDADSLAAVQRRDLHVAA
jgi:hypothetical protein